MLKNDPADTPPEETKSEDIPPHLNGNATVEDRLTMLETIAEGPPRLPDRLIKLENTMNWVESVIIYNKLVAGTAEDKEHHAVARFEAEKANEDTHVELLDLRSRLNEVVRSINDLSATVKWMIIIAALVLAVVINIGWKVLGA